MGVVLYLVKLFVMDVRYAGGCVNHTQCCYKMSILLTTPSCTANDHTHLSCYMMKVLCDLQEEGILFCCKEDFTPTNVMDRWILSFTQSLITYVRDEMARECVEGGAWWILPPQALIQHLSQKSLQSLDFLIFFSPRFKLRSSVFHRIFLNVGDVVLKVATLRLVLQGESRLTIYSKVEKDSSLGFSVRHILFTHCLVMNLLVVCFVTSELGMLSFCGGGVSCFSASFSTTTDYP